MSASPAPAIDNGVPDGTKHPNAGLLAIEHDGVKDAWCSGFYAGPHKADPGTGVFVTAARCLADPAAFGFSGSDLTISFDPEVTIDVDGFTWATAAATRHPGTSRQRGGCSPPAGYGGACYGDSGSPVLRHDSNTAVALVSGGGDAICRAQNHPLRLDIPAARAFYGDYLQLP